MQRFIVLKRIIYEEEWKQFRGEWTVENAYDLGLLDGYLRGLNELGPDLVSVFKAQEIKGEPE